MTVVLVGLALVVLFLARRRRRAAVLAGRDAARPTYAIEPPRRSVGVRRSETL